jgi:hypothetical protein
MNMGKPGADWTLAEDEILINEACLKASQVRKLLPHRNAHSIRARRRILMNRKPGKPVIYRRVWTDEQDDQLRELAGQGLNCAEIAALMNRTPSGIKHRMNKLGGVGEVVETASFTKEPPPKLDQWPDLGPNAFQDIKVSADPRITMGKPETRTSGGVGSRMLIV